MVVVACQENESCSKVLNFLKRSRTELGGPMRRQLQKAIRERI